MDDPRVKSVGRTETSPSTSVNGEILSEQHVTPEPTLAFGVVIRVENETISSGYHWTVRAKISQMTDKHCAMLLKLLAVEFVTRGIDFTGYVAAEYLVTRLQHGKTDPLEVRDEKDRQALLLGHLILASVKGTWFSLGERIEVSPALAQEIIDTGWLPNARTLKSWKQYYRVRDFLEVFAVPMNTYIDEQDRISARYSSYCKGYGNGGHVSRTQKTPYDSEIDGDSTDRDPPSFNLLEIDKYCQLIFALEREKAERIQSGNY